VTDSANGAPAGSASSRRPWLVFRSFQGWRPTDFGADAVAGLTLAAIAIPEQMATARLAGFGPQIGFLALLAGAIGFAIFGDSRRMSIGADSTIAPIFAGALSALAAAGSDHYAAAAGALALAVGVILVLGGVFRLGFIADLLSIPVTTGFLAGIAGHILVSQAPATLGLEDTQGVLIWRAYSLIARIGSANGWTLAIGLGVLALMIVSERISPRFPAALIGLAIAALAVITFGLEARGVETLGEIAGAPLRFSAPAVSLDDLRLIAPLVLRDRDCG
jgi:MFS superfamily sulfate permease-like transporter